MDDVKTRTEIPAPNLGQTDLGQTDLGQTNLGITKRRIVERLKRADAKVSDLARALTAGSVASARRPPGARVCGVGSSRCSVRCSVRRCRSSARSPSSPAIVAARTGSSRSGGGRLRADRVWGAGARRARQVYEQR